MYNYYYEESNNERRRREETQHYFRLLDAQDKELTNTMVEFHHESHVLRILEDKLGLLTVRIRERATAKLLHIVKFQKKPKQGVVYNFRKVDSLSRLCIEKALLPALQAAVAPEFIAAAN